MLTIDGAQGEGGGQILRTSVALSAITGTPMRITNIRAGRKKSGLKRQHATAVNAAASICGASVTGATAGSGELSFTPGPIAGGDYRFSLGTAGSTMLVFQTLLPILLSADAPSTVTLQGGTHNPFAPPFDFLTRAYLPLLLQMGVTVDAKLVRHGFYPAGGGEVVFRIDPCKAWKSIDIHDRGKFIQRSVVAKVSNLPDHIGERECDVIRRKFQWKESDCEVQLIDSAGPGNVVLIELRYENVTEVFVAFGEKGRKTEQVARNLAREVQRYLKSKSPVGDHLADQLMLPMSLACIAGAGASSFRTLDLTDHSTTHIDIIRDFLDVEITREVHGRDDVHITVDRATTC